MKVRDLLRTKGPAVVTIAPEIPIQDAMRVLVQHGIGALEPRALDLEGICAHDRSHRLHDAREHGGRLAQIDVSNGV